MGAATSSVRNWATATVLSSPTVGAPGRLAAPGGRVLLSGGMTPLEVGRVRPYEAGRERVGWRGGTPECAGSRWTPLVPVDESPRPAGVPEPVASHSAASWAAWTACRTASLNRLD